MNEQIVILGSGIIGLYTALQLARKGKACNIIIMAEYMPGDQSMRDFASPWAAANFSCASDDTPTACRHDKLTFQNLDWLANKFPGVIEKLPVREYFAPGEEPTEAKLKSMESFLPKFHKSKRSLPNSNIHEPILCITYQTFNINSPKLLEALKNYLTHQGVTFLRLDKKLEHINQAFLKNTKTVFNCTGLGSRYLGGVEDENVYPARGQVVVVKAPHVKENVMLSTKYSDTYIIPRANSGGLVVLGGYKQDNDWRDVTFSYYTQSILERTRELLPVLENAEVVREVTGLRPCRKGGVRIEREVRNDGRVIIHNYGACGAGFQSGYGMSLDAAALFEKESKL